VKIDRFRAPDEHGAEERGWRVVSAGYAGRTPSRHRGVPLRPLLALVVVAALAAIAFTQAGHAVLTTVRKAIGVERAQPALYSLPSGGRILAGGWLIDADGSARRLGDYVETSWSPFGRFVVATRENELLALDQTGSVRWTLARPNVRFPRWAGSHTDTRIAYLSGSRLHVVAGDGTGDRQVGPAAAAPVAPAWRSGSPLALAYADALGHVWAFEPATGRVLFRTAAGPRPTKVAWSTDGKRLLVLRPSRLDVFTARGRRLSSTQTRFVDAAFLPRTHRLVALGSHTVSLLAPRRVLFRTTGRLARLVPSPDGRRVLVTWPGADQWLFVPTRGGRLRAVANIRRQLGGAAAVGGWTS
jgi:hypothetical protein